MSVASNTQLREEAWQETENAVPAGNVNSSTNKQYIFASGDSCYRGGATTIYAGHTPNPKKLGQPFESRTGQTAFPTTPSVTMTSQPAFDRTETMVPCNMERNPFGSATSVNACVSVPHVDVPHKLNETFSCEDLVEHATDCASDKASLAIASYGQTFLTVPVIDTCLSPSGKKLLESGAHVSEASCWQTANAISDSRDLQPRLQVTSKRMQSTQHSSAQILGSVVSHDLGTQENQSIFCSGGTKVADSAPETKVGTPADTGVAAGSGADQGSRDKRDKENAGPCQRQGTHVKRAINFDAVAASPMRGDLSMCMRRAGGKSVNFTTHVLC